MGAMNLKILTIFVSILHVSAYQFQPVQDGCSYWDVLLQEIESDNSKRLHCIPDQNNQAGIVYATWKSIPAGKCPFFDRYTKQLETFSCDISYGRCPNTSYPSYEASRMKGCFSGLAISQAYEEVHQRKILSQTSNKQSKGEATKIIIAVISTLLIELLVICICKFCVCSSKGRIWRNCGKKGCRYMAVKTRDIESGLHLKKFKGKGGYMPVKTTDDESEEEQSNSHGEDECTQAAIRVESRTSGTGTDVKRYEEDFHLPYIPHVHRDLKAPPDAVKVQPNSQNETWIMDFIPLLSERESHKLLDDKEKTDGQIGICHEDRTLGTDTDVKASSETLICQEDRASGTDTGVERFSQDMICHESRTSGTDAHSKGKGEDCHLPITCVHQDLEVGPDAGKVQQNSQNEILIKDFLPSSSTRKIHEPFESKEKVMATQTKVPENEGCNEEYQARKMKNQATQTNMPEIEGHQTKQMENQASQTNRPENEGNNEGHQGKDIVIQDLDADQSCKMIDLYADLLSKMIDKEPNIPDLYADRLRKMTAEKRNNLRRLHYGDFHVIYVDTPNKEWYNEDNQSKLINNQATKMNSINNELHSKNYQAKHNDSRATITNNLKIPAYNEDDQAKHNTSQATKMNSINIELHNEDNQAKHNDSRATITNKIKIPVYNEDDQAKHNASQAIKTNIPNNRRHNEVTQWNIPLIERHRQLDQPGHMDNKDSALHKLLHWFVISMTKLITKDSVTEDINTL